MFLGELTATVPVMTAIPTPTVPDRLSILRYKYMFPVGINVYVKDSTGLNFKALVTQSTWDSINNRPDVTFIDMNGKIWIHGSYKGSGASWELEVDDTVNSKDMIIANMKANGVAQSDIDTLFKPASIMQTEATRKPEAWEVLFKQMYERESQFLDLLKNPDNTYVTTKYSELTGADLRQYEQNIANMKALHKYGRTLSTEQEEFTLKFFDIAYTYVSNWQKEHRTYAEEQAKINKESTITQKEKLLPTANDNTVANISNTVSNLDTDTTKYSTQQTDNYDVKSGVTGDNKYQPLGIMDMKIAGIPVVFAGAGALALVLLLRR